jgi:hypothetical protein
MHSFILVPCCCLQKLLLQYVVLRSTIKLPFLTESRSKIKLPLLRTQFCFYRSRLQSLLRTQFCFYRSRLLLQYVVLRSTIKLPFLTESRSKIKLPLLRTQFCFYRSRLQSVESQEWWRIKMTFHNSPLKDEAIVYTKSSQLEESKSVFRSYK